MLLARREALRSAIREQMDGMRLGRGAADPADAASYAAHDAVDSELVDLESRELSQVEGALEKMRNGTYGICEGCGKKIQLARLNALPYSTYCIECQREAERNPDWQDRGYAGSDHNRRGPSGLTSRRGAQAAPSPRRGSVPPIGSASMNSKAEIATRTSTSLIWK